MTIFSYFKNKKLLLAFGMTLCIFAGFSFPTIGAFIAQILAN